MSGESRVPAAGVGAYRVYVWLVLGSPVLLLIAAIVLTVVGLILGSEGVATVGAVGVVAALILPRTKGPIEFGPGGFKGETLDDFFSEVLRLGMARGLSRDEATEVAVGQLEESVGSLTAPNYELWRAAWAKARSFGAVDIAADLLEQIRNAVEEALRQRPGWRIRTDSGIEQEPPYGSVDWVLQTDHGLVLIEAQFFTGGNYAALKRFAYERVVARVRPYRAFFVSPGDSPPTERDGVTYVGADQLLGALLAL